MRTLRAALVFAALEGALASRPTAASDLVSAPRNEAISAWADSARREIEIARAHNDADRLASVRARIERALAARPDDALLLHYLGYTGYREINARFARRETGTVASLITASEQALELSAKKRPLAETEALRAMLLGQRIRLDSSTAAALGRRAAAHMQRAIELDRDNPRVWLLQGMRTLFVPSDFGGGPERARGHLERALALFERDRAQPPAPTWGRAEVHLWLGQAHQKLGDRAQAREAYARALALEPENIWIRSGLLPALERATP